MEESNDYTASRQFRIYKKLVCDWYKNKANLENIPNLKKKASWYGELP